MPMPVKDSESALEFRIRALPAHLAANGKIGEPT